VTYKNGLRFSSPLDQAMISLKKRIHSKKASMLIIDGGVGEGKTTLAVELAEYYQRKPLNYTRQYSMGGEHFQENLVKCYDSQEKVIIYDEAGDFNSRGAMTGFNKMLNRVFDTFRAFKILIILVLPSFSVLDKPLFDKNIPRLLVHCHSRTKFGHFSAYSLYRMYYLKAKMKKYTVPSFAYNHTSPNFRGHFLDLDKEESKKLEKISMDGKKNIVNQNILENRGLVTYKQIARKLGRSEIWVKKKVNKLGLKEKTIYKRHKYFDKGLVLRLKDEI